MQVRWLLIAGALAYTFAAAQLSWSVELQPRQLFIAGDSTAASYQQGDHQGWGAVLPQYFDATQLTVDNRARGGRSSRTFIREGLWKSLVDDVQPGDLVLIQFGHNDAGKLNDPDRARGSLPGIGTETTEIFNLQTQQHETVYTFGHYIRTTVADVRAKQGVPVLLSLTARNDWKNGRIERSAAQYGHWTYLLAVELNTPFIDVTNLVADDLERLGKSSAAELFPNDPTHFNAAGAELHARNIVCALKGMRPGIDVSAYSSVGLELPAHDWTFLRLPPKADDQLASIFLVGDSTVRNGTGIGAGGQWGWGDFLDGQTNIAEFDVVNRAVGGLSSRTFVTGGHWQRALSMMRPGDYVVIQFGHNDAGAINDPHRARGSIPGVGDEVRGTDNLLTGEDELVHTYGWYLRKMVGEAVARGVNPIIASPVPRMIWDDSGKRIKRAIDSYPQWSKIVAEESNVPFIDLHRLVAERYNQLGPNSVKSLFADKHTHTSEKGARLTAELVANELNAIVKSRNTNVTECAPHQPLTAEQG